jgi:hypothetical protein
MRFLRRTAGISLLGRCPIFSATTRNARHIWGIHIRITALVPPLFQLILMVWFPGNLTDGLFYLRQLRRQTVFCFDTSFTFAFLFFAASSIRRCQASDSMSDATTVPFRTLRFGDKVGQRGCKSMQTLSVYLESAFSKRQARLGSLATHFTASVPVGSRKQRGTISQRKLYRAFHSDGSLGALAF